MKNYAILLLALAPLVLAANQTCIAQCHQTTPSQPYAPSCCSCCGAGASCNGNQEFATCCAATQSFCGCISSRAYCAGSIYNGAQPESSFGTCFDSSSQGCFYDPNPNTWIVCPVGRTGCIGSAYGSDCCTSDQTCNTQTGSCVAKSSSSAATTQTTQTTPTTQSNGPATCAGQQYDSAQYTCTINEQNQQVLCQTGFSSCGKACYPPSQYCCDAGQLKPTGQCAGAATSKTTLTSQQTTQQTTQTSQQTSAAPTTTNNGPATCNGQQYDTTNYDCPKNGAGHQVLCPKGNLACGSGCYSPSSYCCENDQLRQPGQCSAQTSQQTSQQTTHQTTQQTSQQTSTSAPATSTSGPATCNGQQYDTTNYDCPKNGAGNQVLCPKGNLACGSGCYSPSSYCCQNDQLRQPGQCSAASSTVQPTSTGTASTCNGAAYDPKTQFCCSPANGYGSSAVCQVGQHCCGNLLNGTAYFGPQDIYTGCYDPSVDKCCYGGTSAFLNPSEIKPNSYTIPQGTVQQCVN